jgi:hypothetical protein
MRHDMRGWIPPLIGIVAYPGLIVAFGWVINDFHRSVNAVSAIFAFLTMLLAMSVPVLALRALILMRHDEEPGLARGILYLMFAAPPLFVFIFSLTRIAGTDGHLAAIWITGWAAIGVMLSLGAGNTTVRPRASDIAWLRVTHGGVALGLLCIFLIAHLINHGLAAWSVPLHGTVMKFLRVWYRSEWVQPLLLVLLVVMICTGVPMVVHHARKRMDTFGIIQTATGIYIAVFICSHVLATLNGRRVGVETDWSFAVGPTSLLDGAALRGMFIPYYIYAVLFLTLHVGCGTRVVLLQHGVSKEVGNRALYGLAGAGLIITLVISAAMLGYHVKASN